MNLNTCVNYYKNISATRSFTLATESDQIILPTKAKAADCHRKFKIKLLPQNHDKEKLKLFKWQL